MSKPYYVLAEWDIATSEWHPQFGDFERYIVNYEREDYLQSGNYRAKFLHIVTSKSSRQGDVNAALAAHPAPKPSKRN